ncbi:hypothetical protein [Pseudomonas aeruginosa]|uniref:hypothetical protein n=1 Tax=Pseudomonas aeruginosa TaxID=287 RepID=UPI0034DEDE47
MSTLAGIIAAPSTSVSGTRPWSATIAWKWLRTSGLYSSRCGETNQPRRSSR